MMRRLFAATFGISAMLSLIVGVAFAWTANTGKIDSSADVGELKVDVAQVKQSNNKLYPTGSPITILTGKIRNNTAANPGIDVMINANDPGSVNYLADTLACSTTHLGGNVTAIDNSPVAPGGQVGGEWAVNLVMASGAPDSCQGETISFQYQINVTTP